MKAADLRKWHRYLGVGLAAFIILQAGTGVLITAGAVVFAQDHEHSEAGVHEKSGSNIRQSGGDVHAAKPHHDVSQGMEPVNYAIMIIHHGGGLVGTIYRILLGTGILMQTVLGTLIFLRTRSRTRKST